MRLPVQAGGVLPSSSRNGVRPSISFCASVSVQNGQVCVSIPILGDICIPIPISLPSGTAVQACVSTCDRFGIPLGACITVTALGQQVTRQCVGVC